MGILFSAGEIVTMAAQLEENGMKFYNEMAAQTRDEESKELFTFLASEEVRHKTLFQKMIGSFQELELSPAEEEQYVNYLGALTGSRIFKSDLNIPEMLEGVKDHIAALEMAINFEKDSIIFYYELKGQTIKSDKRKVDNVINEEKTHLVKLIALRDKLAKK